MIRKKLLRELAKIGAKFVRHGANHDIYGKGQKYAQVPRHPNINERTAKSILKTLS